MNALVFITGKLQTLYKGAKTTVTRNGRIVELKNNLRNLDSALSDKYHEFGEFVYKALKSGDSPELDGMVNKLDELIENYNSTVDELDRLQNVIRCPQCGAVLKPSYSFCPICGSSAPKPEDKVVICPNCGRSNDASGAFCTHCGTPLRDSEDKKIVIDMTAKEDSPNGEPQA